VYVCRREVGREVPDVAHQVGQRFQNDSAIAVGVTDHVGRSRNVVALLDPATPSVE
jgi:hypothetical protein